MTVYFYNMNRVFQVVDNQSFITLEIWHEIHRIYD